MPGIGVDLMGWSVCEEQVQNVGVSGWEVHYLGESKVSF